MELKDMDIVYPYVEDWEDGKELLYSIRTVAKNVPHRNIVIIWDCPSRINKKNIIHIPIDDDKTDKYTNVKYKLLKAMRSEKVSDCFVWMNDDMLILKPIKKIPYYTYWTLKFHADAVERRSGHSRYWWILTKTREWFPRGKSFECHTPFIFDKKLLKQYFDTYWYDITGYAIRSTYGNLYCKSTPYKKHFGRNDCKSYSWRWDEMWNLNELVYVSTFDEIKFAYVKRLDSKFDKSIYEL